MLQLLFLGRTQRIDSFNRDPVFLLHLVHEVVGFGKQEFCVQGEDAKVLAHSGSNIDQDHALGAKSGGDRHPVSESVECPAENALGVPGVRGNLQLPYFFFQDFFFHATGSSSGLKLAVTLSAIAASNPWSARLAASSTKLRSAIFTTSPTTRRVGEASCGALRRSETVVRYIRWSGVVAREIIAHGVLSANPASTSRLEISP